MSFNNYSFVFGFMPITVMIYFTMLKFSKNNTMSRVFIILISLFFLGLSDIPSAVIFLVTATLNLCFGHIIKNSKRPKFFLGLGILTHLFILTYYKYFSSYFPLALSFYTFQQIVFLLSIGNGLTDNINPLNYASFSAFFPYLISGPVSRYQQIVPQMEKLNARKFTETQIVAGLSIFFVGLFKKQVLANTISIFSEPLFDLAVKQSFGFFAAWFAALSYTVQLYFDFSGYSDMAVGVAWLLGIRIPINFYSPLKAGNIMDFWRRWHMSFSSVILSFLFTPLATLLTRFSSRQNLPKSLEQFISLGVPAIVTFAIVGAWHGTGWNFVLFGLIHGAFFALNLYWRKFKNSFVTMLIVVVAFVVFRSADLFMAKRMLSGMFFANGLLANLEMISGQAWIWLFALLALVLFAPNTREIFGSYYPSLDVEILPQNAKAKMAFTWHPNLVGLVGSSIVTLIAILYLGNGTSFLYFRF